MMGAECMKRFFIISGGKIEDAFAKAVLNGVAEKTVIAADSGMEFLRRNEIIPQIIIGDFDRSHLAIDRILFMDKTYLEKESKSKLNIFVIRLGGEKNFII